MPETRKDERFEIRMSSAEKKAIAEAARARGMTASEFALKAAMAASRKTLARVQVIRLSQRDQIAMVNALINPPPPNARLRKAMARYNKLVSKD